jgi:hypothetical protein
MAEGMVERVARALEALCEHDGEPVQEMARAAIAAMREPTREMIIAGERVAPAAEGYSMPDDIPDTWRAMIDAALA